MQQGQRRRKEDNRLESVLTIIQINWFSRTYIYELGKLSHQSTLARLVACD